MKQNDIYITLTEFVNFINSSGMAKMTVVSAAKAKKFDVAGELFKRKVDILSSVEAQSNKRAA